MEKFRTGNIEIYQVNVDQRKAFGYPKTVHPEPSPGTETRQVLFEVFRANSEIPVVLVGMDEDTRNLRPTDEKVAGRTMRLDAYAIDDQHRLVWMHKEKEQDSP